jgi:hypothetical protein
MFHGFHATLICLHVLIFCRGISEVKCLSLTQNLWGNKHRIQEESAGILDDVTCWVMDSLWWRLEQYVTVVACSVFFYNSKYWIMRWNFIVLFYFKNCQVFLLHPVILLWAVPHILRVHIGHMQFESKAIHLHIDALLNVFMILCVPFN